MTGPIASALADLNDIRDFERTPYLQRYPVDNTYQLIQESDHKYGDDPALTFLSTGAKDETGTEITYRQLTRRITQTANLLNSLGVLKNDAFAILLPMLPETHYALWGGAAAGIASPINPFLEARHIAEIMQVTHAKVLMTLAPEWDTSLWQKVTEVVKSTPDLEAIILVSRSGKGLVKEITPPREGLELIDYHRLIDQQADDHLASGRNINARDRALYLHTGGTTGRPKVVPLGHGNLSFMCQLYVDMTFREQRFSYLSGLPLFHVYGIGATSLSAFIAGRHMVIMTPEGFRNPKVIRNFWHHVERFKCPIFATVPTLLNTLLETPVGDNDISCLQEVATGGAPLPELLKRNFEEKIGVNVLNGYGMTESSLMLARSPIESPPPAGSVGMRIPYMKMIVAVVDGQKLVRECKINETGTVLVQGPNMFSGYLNPQDNENAWVNYYWFNTGDLGYLDKQGNLFLTGRSKDMILRSGHNIDPALIEEPLCRHAAINQAVAIGQADAYAGEIPVAFVTLKPGHSANIPELMDYCRASISERAAVPKRIEIIEQIPLTAVGKCFRPALRQRAGEYAISVILEQAGVNASVSVRQAQRGGLIATIGLLDASQRDCAKTLLQGFPLKFEFEENHSDNSIIEGDI